MTFRTGKVLSDKNSLATIVTTGTITSGNDFRIQVHLMCTATLHSNDTDNINAIYCHEVPFSSPIVMRPLFRPICNYFVVLMTTVVVPG